MLRHLGSVARDCNTGTSRDQVNRVCLPLRCLSLGLTLVRLTPFPQPFPDHVEAASQSPVVVANHVHGKKASNTDLYHRPVGGSPLRYRPRRSSVAGLRTSDFDTAGSPASLFASKTSATSQRSPKRWRWPSSWACCCWKQVQK